MRHLVAGLLAMVFFVSTAVPATVPRKAVEFGFELPGGKQVLLSQYRGKAGDLGGRRDARDIDFLQHRDVIQNIRELGAALL